MQTAPRYGSKARRITDRFPAFTQGGGPVFRQVVAALAAPLEELDQALHQTMESHWVERAGGGDLERIGSLFAVLSRPGETPAAYRRRLMREVATVLRYGCSPRGIFEAAAATLALELKRGDDGLALIQEVDAYRRRVETHEGHLLEMEEHPMHTRVESLSQLVTGQRFSFTSWGYEPRLQEPARPTITLVAGAQPVDSPLVVNLTTAEAVTYLGKVPKGARLVFPPSGPILLNGQQAPQAYRMKGPLFDQVGRFGDAPFVYPVERSPGLPVGSSDWAFFGGFAPSRGVFPAGQATGAEVILTWEERQRTAFVLRLPPALKGDHPDEVLDRARLAIHRVRAAGVSARVEFAK